MRNGHSLYTQLYSNAAKQAWMSKNRNTKRYSQLPKKANTRIASKYSYVNSVKRELPRARRNRDKFIARTKALLRQGPGDTTKYFHTTGPSHAYSMRGGARILQEGDGGGVNVAAAIIQRAYRAKQNRIRRGLARQIAYRRGLPSNLISRYI